MDRTEINRAIYADKVKELGGLSHGDFSCINYSMKRTTTFTPYAEYNDYVKKLTKKKLTN